MMKGKQIMKKKSMVLTIAIATVLGLSACSLSAKENVTSNPEVQKDNQIIEVKESDVDVENGSTDNGEPENASSDNETQDGEDNNEAKADYWYIDNLFRDALGHEFTFLEPDEKGNPTKIRIAGYNDEQGNNGEFEFEADPSCYYGDDGSEVWIIGTIKGNGDISKKDELVSSDGKYIGVDIWFVGK